MVFFICCIIGIIVFSILAEKRESTYFLFFAVVLLICVIGLRSESVGIDTTNYYYQFRLISSNSRFVSFNEKSFVAICRLLMRFLPEYWMLIFVFSSIIGFFVMLRLWDFRDRVSFSTAVALFLIFHLAGTMNIMRQYISIAILFYASRYLDKKKIVRFLIGVLIACSFHLSAIVGVALIPMMILCKNTGTKRYLRLLLIIGVMAPFGLTFWRNNIDNYSFFINNSAERSVGIGLVAKLTVLVLFWITAVRQKQGEERVYLKYWCLIDFLYIMLSSLGYRFIYMNRVALPFSLFEIVLYSYMISYQTKVRIKVGQNVLIGVYAIPVCILCAYVVFQNIVYDGHDIFPYVTIWQ